MGWADRYIEQLAKGEVVQFRPRGNSMRGRIEDGQLVTVDPTAEPQVGDAVLCTVKGHQYLHLVKSKQTRRTWRGKRPSAGGQSGTRYQIGSNTGKINGWIGRKRIHGVVIAVES